MKLLSQYFITPFILTLARLGSQTNDKHDGAMVSSINFINNDRGNSMVSNHAIASCPASLPEFINSFSMPKDVCEKNIKVANEYMKQKDLMTEANYRVDNEVNHQCAQATKTSKDKLDIIIKNRRIACENLQTIIDEIKNVKLINVRMPDGKIGTASPDLQPVAPGKCFTMTSDELDRKIQQCRKYVKAFKDNNKFGDKDKVRQNDIFINSLNKNLDLLGSQFQQLERKAEDILRNLQSNCKDQKFSNSWGKADSATPTLDGINKLIDQLENDLQSLNTIVIPPSGPIRA